MLCYLVGWQGSTVLSVRLPLPAGYIDDSAAASRGKQLVTLALTNGFDEVVCSG